jgi:hypothetical protein
MPDFTGEDRASERAPFYEWLTAFCRAMGAQALAVRPFSFLSFFSQAIP